MKKLIALLLSYVYLVMTPAMAQNGDDILQSTQNDLILVAAAGAGGAILGLSTLSFVDKPSKHISNIWMGAALGVIAGVMVVAYNSAQKGSEELQSTLHFSTHERVAWHATHEKNLTLDKVQFSTQFWRLSF
jgi:zinc transporter ZupT